MTASRHSRTLRVAARQLAEVMHSDRCAADRAFDHFLPERLRVVSPFYWSPLAVAQRAAEWFTDAGVHTVVDIGSGAGKFCNWEAVGSDWSPRTHLTRLTATIRHYVGV